MSKSLSTLVLATVVAAALAVAASCGRTEETPTPQPEVPATPETPATPGTPPLKQLAQDVNDAVKQAAKAPEKAPELPFPEKVAKSIPLNVTIVPQPLAGKNVSAVRCTIEGHEFIGDSTFNSIGRIEMGTDGMLYIVDQEQQVRRFTIGGGADACTLTLDAAFGTAGVLNPGSKVKELSAFRGDRLYASAGFGNTYRLTKGQVDVTCTTSRQGYLVSDPAGSNLLGFFTSPPVRRIAYNDAGCTVEDWAIELPLKSINQIAFLGGGNIAVGGQLTEQVEGRNPHIVVVLNKSGAEQYRIGNPAKGFGDDRFGWIHAVEQCGKSVCVLDSNYRRLSMWKSGGEFAGAISLSKLFGVDYPWISDFEIIPGNKAYFSVSQQRTSQLEGVKRSGVHEGMIFRTTFGG